MESERPVDRSRTPHHRIGRATLALTLATLSACGRLDPGWSPVDLTGTGAGEIVALASADGGWLIGRHDQHAPVRSSVHRFDPATGAAASVRMSQPTGYAAEARLLSISAQADHVIAVGGARGGAHGNVRWSVWAGDGNELTEQPQPFETFGGWGAGALTGSAATTAGPVIVGSWAAESGAGFDIAIWRPDGARWLRTSQPGSALLATRSQQPEARAVAATPRHYVIVGAVTSLAGAPQATPTAWVAESPAGPWQEVRLPVPSPEAAGHAVAVSCGSGHCVIAGRTGRTVIAWRLTVDPGHPPIVGEGVRLDQSSPDDATILAAAGKDQDRVAIAAGADTRVVGVRSAGTTEDRRLPGTPTAMAASPEGEALLATSDGSGDVRLWRSAQ